MCPEVAVSITQRKRLLNILFNACNITCFCPILTVLSPAKDCCCDHFWRCSPLTNACWRPLCLMLCQSKRGWPSFYQCPILNRSHLSEQQIPICQVEWVQYSVTRTLWCLNFTSICCELIKCSWRQPREGGTVA